MSGSTSVAPLAAKLAQKYVQSHNVQFRLSQGGSDVGVSDVAHGRVSIGNSSRDPKPTDPGGLVFHKIARDAICVVTNTANPLPNLEPERSPGDFPWQRSPLERRSGGRAREQHDRPVRSHRGLGDAGRVPEAVHGSGARSTTRSQSSWRRTGLIQQKVKSDKDGIGYVSLFFAKGTHAVAYKGVACNLRNAKSGQYGGVRNFWMVTKGNQPAAAIAFIHWVQNSSAAQQHRRDATGCRSTRNEPGKQVRIPALIRRSSGPRDAGQRNRVDQRAELVLGALACLVLALIVGMIIFVFQKAWPSFSHNGFAWFGPGGNVDNQLVDIFNSPADPANYDYTLRAWPLIYATALITIVSVAIGIVVATLSAIFIVEFAPAAIRRVLEPVVRFLAAVPSVIYGLIGILVIVPFVLNNFISQQDKSSVAYVVQFDGSSIGVGILILTVMITPIMIAIVVDALRAGPEAVDRGGRVPWGSTASAPCGRSASGRRGPRSSRPPFSPRRGRSARRSCSRWSPGRWASRRTRSTAGSSSWSRRARWPRRSSTTPKGCRWSRSGRRSTPSRRCCWFRAPSCRSPAGTSAA